MFWHVNKQFLPIKVAYFWFYAGLIAMLPLLTVHMKQLGLNMHDVAQIYLLLPFFSCIGPPVIGYIADRTGHIRRCFVLTVVLNTILHHALLLVPPSKHTLSLTSRETAFRLNRSCQSDWSSGRISQWLSHPNISRPNLVCATSCVNTTEKTITPEVAMISIVGNSSSFQQQLGTSWLHSGNASFVGNALCEGRGADCWVSCQMTVEGLQSSRVTFWTYALLRLAGCFFLAPSLTLIDATTVALTKQHRIRGQNYGRQRSMGLVASIIFPPITGALVDVVSTPDYRDYSPCFYIMDICVTLSIASFLVFNIRISLPEKTSFRKVLKVLRQVEVQAFVFFIIILGMMWGFLEAFLFVFLIELNAPTCLLGLTLTVAGLASLPFTWYSEIICDKLGYINILIISFFGYTARYLGYSLISTAWWCFPFELLQVITTHLMWNSVVSYAAQVAPSGFLATLTGMTAAVHYSLGRGLGTFLGGYLVSSIGSSATFQAMGGLAAAAGTTYLILHYSCLNRIAMNRKHTDAPASGDPAEDRQAGTNDVET